MTIVTFNGTQYECEKNESVLETLTRHGVFVPSSCRSGICQTCLMKAIQGQPPIEAQQGLRESQRAGNYFLSCICKPCGDMEVALPSAEALSKVNVTVVAKMPLNDNITQFFLQCKTAFDYRAGQFINIHRADGLIRSYSIASLQNENRIIEIHVKKLMSGQMSNWLHTSIAIGDTLEISGPYGECFYNANDTEQPILLIGTGSGLAPLLGVVRDALSRQHRGSIHLFHGSHSAADLYFVNDLKKLEEKYDNFRYVPCVSDDEKIVQGVSGRVDIVALTSIKKLSGWRVYLCGNPDMVKSTKRKAYLAGASLKEIFADPFVNSTNPV